MQFYPEDIVNVSVYVYDNLAFDRQEDLAKYVDSCPCTFETTNFFSTLEDHLIFNSMEELKADFVDDAEFMEMVRDFEDDVDAMLRKYEISYRKSRGGLNLTYELEGTYGNMKEFLAGYDPHIDLSNPGILLDEFEENVDIDFENGDQKYVSMYLNRK